MKDILKVSVNRMLALRVEPFGEHGICYFNESNHYAFHQQEASLEQALTLSKRPKWQASAIRHWETCKAELAENYHSFNLTKSGVIAYVYLHDSVLEAYNRPKVLFRMQVETISPKPLAKYILENWLKNENIISFDLIAGKGE